MSDYAPELPPPEPPEPPPPPEPEIEAAEVQSADYEDLLGPEQSTELDYGFYGDGPQQGFESFDQAAGGLYGEGVKPGVFETNDLPGGFYTDRPFGDSRR